MKDLPGNIKSTAIFGGSNNEYRYVLTRVWDESLPAIAFLMLNPSTADERKDDPTVAKCRRLATRWGYGALHVLNLFAIRATDPRDMKRHPYPIGSVNSSHIVRVAKDIRVIAAWGNHGSHRGRAAVVCRCLREYQIPLFCLRVTKQGEPQHPLYIPENIEPQEYHGTTTT